MELSIEDLKKLATLAKVAAHRAGLVVKEYAQKEFIIYSKDVGSSKVSQVVSEVDFLSQNIILDCLKNSISKYDLGILTEENEDNLSRLEKDYFWSIDPLDGTYSFSKKQEGYSISIALVSKKGDSVLGIVYNPVNDNTYVGIRGVDVFKNDENWEIDNKTKDMFTFFQDRSFLTNEKVKNEELQELVESLGYNTFEIVTGSGAVMNAIQVLEDEHSCYLKLPKKQSGGGSLWDFSATVCMFNQLGFYAVDVRGDNLNLNNEKTTFMNQKGIVFTQSEKVKNTIVKWCKAIENNIF